jgi:hypothetical protein
VRVLLDTDPEGRMRYSLSAPERALPALRSALGVFDRVQAHVIEPDPEPAAEDEPAPEKTVEVVRAELRLLLVNARHVKQVPGRKTDVKDAEWLCQLAEAGLLKASFVPPKPIRALRNLTRYRKTQIQERSREANRLHKALEDTGIKLDCVASDILGASGRLMLDALVAGTTDPEVLADLAKGRLRAKLPALRGPWRGVSISCTPSGSARSSPTWTSRSRL